MNASEIATSITCAGCGAVAKPGDPYPFRCPQAKSGDDVDRVMTIVLDPSRVRFPDWDEPNPFLRYRSFFHSYDCARAHGLSDADYVEVVERLDAAVTRVDGRGFAVTPFGRNGPLRHC